MGSLKDDKWLEQLKNSVQNYSEHLPDNFWEELQKDMPQVVPEVPKRKFDRIMLAAPVAAALLLVMFIVWPHSTPVGQSGVIAVLEEYEPQGEIEVSASVEQSVEIGRKISVQHIPVDEEDAGTAYDADDCVSERENGDTSGDVKKNDDIVEVKKVEESVGESEMGKKKDEERKQYMKELEYLKGDTYRRRGKSTIAFAGGRGRVGIPDFGGMDEFAVMDNPVSSDNWGMVNFLELQNYTTVQWLGTMPALSNGVQYVPLSYNHKMPLKIGVSFAKEIKERLYVESGVSYQYLKSNASYDIVQKLHFVGIPVELSYNFAEGRALSAYVSAGALFEKCIIGVLEEGRYNEVRRLDLDKIYTSVLFQLGGQLELGGGAALYLEPGVYYYFGMNHNGELARDYGYIIKSIYSENPLGFSLQGGVKFSF